LGDEAALYITIHSLMQPKPILGEDACPAVRQYPVPRAMTKQAWLQPAIPRFSVSRNGNKTEAEKKWRCQAMKSYRNAVQSL